MIDYTAQLKDVRWLSKKKKVLARSMFKCEQCGRSDRALCVHHMYYIRNRNAWQYPFSALKALCHNCHGDWHDKFEINVLEKARTKRKLYKAPTKVKPHKGPKYYKWQEHVKVSKRKKRSLLEQQSDKPEYKERSIIKA